MFKKKRVLITGVAGFIGFYLAKKLCENGFFINGIDNFDPYYSVNLKKKRIEHLKKFKNFQFKKIDIVKKNLLKNYFNKNIFDQVIHLAAQAGDRYSLTHPYKYLDVNFLGYTNVLENVINKKIDKFIFASSSSVYGEQKKYPVKENYKLNPQNIYAQTKVLNENISYDLSHTNSTKFVGLRLFTIYGETGRPDIFINKYLNSAYLENKIDMIDKDNYYSDYVYIDDVTEIIKKLILKRDKKKYQIFNISSNKSISITDLVKIISPQHKISKFSIIKKFNYIDISKNHGSNNKIRRYVGYKKFINLREGIKKIIQLSKKKKYNNFLNFK